MFEPVILMGDEQIYEEEAVEQHLQAGTPSSSRSPVTNLPLPDGTEGKRLVRQNQMRNLIRDFLRDNPEIYTNGEYWIYNIYYPVATFLKIVAEQNVAQFQRMVDQDVHILLIPDENNQPLFYRVMQQSNDALKKYAIRAVVTERQIEYLAGHKPANWDATILNPYLFEAAKDGVDSIVRGVIALGVNPNIIEGTLKITPLLLACYHGHLEVVKSLLALGATYNVVDSENKNVLHIAVSGDRAAVLHFLLSNPQTATLLENKDNSGATPLGFAVLGLALCGGRINAARALLEHGANVNASISGNNTLLHEAIGRKNRDLIILLLEYGANEYAQNDDHKTPLDLAVGDTDLMKFVLEQASLAKQRLAAEVIKLRSFAQAVKQNHPTLSELQLIVPTIPVPPPSVVPTAPSLATNVAGKPPQPIVGQAGFFPAPTDKTHEELMRKLANDLHADYQRDIYAGSVTEQTFVGMAGIQADQSSAQFRRDNESCLTRFRLNMSEAETQQFRQYYDGRFPRLILKIERAGSTVTVETNTEILYNEVSPAMGAFRQQQQRHAP